jgi:hypothetical protein
MDILFHKVMQECSPRVSVIPDFELCMISPCEAYNVLYIDLSLGWVVGVRADHRRPGEERESQLDDLGPSVNTHGAL